MTIDLKKFTDDELCEMHDLLNGWEWDDRLGEQPENVREAIMFVCVAIRHQVGGKRLLRWHHINNLGSTPEDFERWYEIRLDHAVFSHPDSESRWGDEGFTQIVSGEIRLDELKVVFKNRARKDAKYAADNQLNPRPAAVRFVSFVLDRLPGFAVGVLVGAILSILLKSF